MEKRSYWIFLAVLTLINVFTTMRRPPTVNITNLTNIHEPEGTVIHCPETTCTCSKS